MSLAPLDPAWVSGVTSSDARRRYIEEPGSEVNPLVIKDNVFTDARIELGESPVMHFENCYFTRSPWLGKLKHLHQTDCHAVDVREPVGDVTMYAPGTSANPLMFYRRVFPHTFFELKNVYMCFTECTFIYCEFYGGANCTFERCVFDGTIQTYIDAPIAFYCRCGDKTVFGYIRSIPHGDYVYPGERDKVVRDYLVSPEFGSLKQAILDDNAPPPPQKPWWKRASEKVKALVVKV